MARLNSATAATSDTLISQETALTIATPIDHPHPQEPQGQPPIQPASDFRRRGDTAHTQVPATPTRRSRPFQRDTNRDRLHVPQSPDGGIPLRPFDDPGTVGPTHRSPPRTPWSTRRANIAVRRTPLQSILLGSPARSGHATRMRQIFEDASLEDTNLSQRSSGTVLYPQLPSISRPCSVVDHNSSSTSCHVRGDSTQMQERAERINPALKRPAIFASSHLTESPSNLPTCRTPGDSFDVRIRLLRDCASPPPTAHVVVKRCEAVKGSPNSSSESWSGDSDFLINEPLPQAPTPPVARPINDWLDEVSLEDSFSYGKSITLDSEVFAEAESFWRCQPEPPKPKQIKASDIPSVDTRTDTSTSSPQPPPRKLSPSSDLSQPFDDNQNSFVSPSKRLFEPPSPLKNITNRHRVDTTSTPQKLQASPEYGGVDLSPLSPHVCTERGPFSSTNYFQIGQHRSSVRRTKNIRSPTESPKPGDDNMPQSVKTVRALSNARRGMRHWRPPGPVSGSRGRD